MKKVRTKQIVVADNFKSRSEFLPTGDYFSLANLYSQDYKIYGYEMDKAPIK